MLSDENVADDSDEAFFGQDLESETNQLNRIFSIIGTPSADEIDRLSHRLVREALRRFPKRSPKPISSMLPGVDEAAVALLRDMLAFDPRKRISVSEALASPYLASVREADKERMYEGPPLTLDFEDGPQTRHALRRCILQEIQAHHGHAVPEAPPLTPRMR